MAPLDEFEDEGTQNYFKESFWAFVTVQFFGVLILGAGYLWSSPDTFVRTMPAVIYVIIFLLLTVISQIHVGRRLMKERNEAVAKLRTQDLNRGLEKFASATAVQLPNASISGSKSLTKREVAGGLLIETHDHILIESGKSKDDIIVSTNEGQLECLSQVVYTFRNLRKSPIDRCDFRLVKTRQGQILSAHSSRAGYPQFKSEINVNAQGVGVVLKNVGAMEFFKVEILTDGLREADFRFEAISTEPGDLKISILQQDYWIPIQATQ